MQCTLLQLTVTESWYKPTRHVNISPGQGAGGTLACLHWLSLQIAAHCTCLQHAWAEAAWLACGPHNHCIRRTSAYSVLAKSFAVTRWSGQACKQALTCCFGRLKGCTSSGCSALSAPSSGCRNSTCSSTRQYRPEQCEPSIVGELNLPVAC